MHRGLLICLLLVAAPAIAAGQSIKPGTHVRVWTTRHVLVQGSVTSVTNESIVVDTVRVPVNSISQLHVRYRRRRAGRGAVIGGITLGALSGIALGGACAGSSGEFIDCSEQVPVAVVSGALVGFTVGAGIGAVIGAFVKTEDRNRWQLVDLDRLRFISMPRQASPLAFGLSLSF